MSKEQHEHEQSSLLLALPAAPLTLVLSCLGLKDRLCSCALTCRALASFAPTATDDITLTEVSKAKRDQLLQWLASHGAQVTRLSLSGDTCWPRPSCKLGQLMQACPNLRQLELCGWRVDCAQLAPPNTPTALYLELTLCNTSGGQHLSALQGSLQHATLNSCTVTDPAASVSALLQLSQLTALVFVNTRSDLDRHRYSQPGAVAAVCAAISNSLSLQLGSLTRLQQLKLHTPPGVSTDFVTALANLASSLTALELHATGTDGNSSNFTCLGCLSSLHHLDLSCCSELNPALLLPGLRKLRSLTVAYSTLDPHIPPAAYLHLTAASGLTSLSCCVVAAGVDHMFKQPLPQLQALTLLSFAANFDTIGVIISWQSVGLTSEQVKTLVDCCPGLQQLKLTGVQPGVQMTPFKRLSGLTRMVHGYIVHDVDAIARL